MKILRFLLLSTFLSSFPQTSLGQESLLFKKQYLQFDLRKNFPVANGLSYLRSGSPSLGLSYLHVLSQDWLVGVSVSFKDLSQREDDSSIAFLELSNQAQYIFRLHHPIYLLLGTKWLYLSATKSVAFPLSKEEEFRSEVGVALTSSIVWRFSKEWLWNMRLDRWRGVGSNRLHGLELALGLARSLD